MRSRATLFLALFAGMLGREAHAAPRLALVIGNRGYQLKDAALHAPAADAMAIGEALCDTGFEVDQLIDGTRTATLAAIARFQAQLEANPSAEAVVFYAGHGAQVAGLNYLIPVDMPKVKESEFGKAAVPVESIYDAFRYGKPRFSLVILDACRDNPYGATAKGLAEPREPDAVVRLGIPNGTITAFATGYGETARDSSDAHSPYTTALLDSLGEPGLTLADFFIRVHNALKPAGQSPVENVSQMAPFLFRDPAFLRVTANEEIDDDLMVTAGAESYITSLDGHSKQLRLLPGDNVITAMVVNYRSADSLGRREGWHYDATLNAVGGTAAVRFHAREEEAPRQRWGKTFIVARARVHVDSHTAQIRIDDEEPVVWEDGFSLLAVDASNRLYESIRWALVDAGVGLVTDLAHLPVRQRPLAEIVAEIRELHRRSLTHAGATPHDEADAIAHKAHAAAIELLDAANQAGVAMIIDRIKRETRDELAVNIGRMFADPDAYFVRVLKGFAAERKYVEFRYYYAKQMASDDRARHLMPLVADEELETILQRFR